MSKERTKKQVVAKIVTLKCGCVVDDKTVTLCQKHCQYGASLDLLYLFCQKYNYMKEAREWRESFRKKHEGKRLSVDELNAMMDKSLAALLRRMCNQK